MGNSSQTNLEVCEPAMPAAAIDSSLWSLRNTPCNGRIIGPLVSAKAMSCRSA